MTARPVRQRSIAVRGGRPLVGVVPIGGYKHALTVVVAAAVALGRAVALRNVPRTTESEVLDEILVEMGATSTRTGGEWDLDTTTMEPGPIPPRLSRQVHSALYLLPALLARFGAVTFAGAGGDRIGSPEQGGERPTAQVGVVMERFGASLRTVGTVVEATAARLRGTTIDLLEFSTHPTRLRGPAASSATKTALLLAALADGRTTLRNPVDRDATRELCEFLCRCGVLVTRDEHEWRVEGAATVRPGGPRGPSPDPVVHHLVSDSTEIVTFAAGAACAGGSLLLTGITGERTWGAIGDELRVLEGIGLSLTRGVDWLRVARPSGPLRPASIEIECNGFSTDAHPLLALALLGADGESTITDHVWSSRFAYVSLLDRMGGRARVRGNTVRLLPSVMRPPPAPLRPMDSRAAAVAVLAGLGTGGTTRVEDDGHLDRSYERLVDKLRGVGAQVEDTGSTTGR